MVTFDYKKTPITQIADYIIMYSAKSGASDVHFDPRDNGLMVRIRIDGDLQNYTLVPPEYQRNLITRLKLLSNMNITESRLPQDGAIKGKFGKLFLDMRVSCLPTNEGEKIVIRILDYSKSLQGGLPSLGFNYENMKKLNRMIGVPNGILLVTGATGSGKSTTTYSILQKLNKSETNIITVEDPVEMNIEGLNQVQVNSEIGLDFATVLRSILRQDPNIILIGEIRDSETARIAVRASITGHFVISTIHTNDSLSTIERLLDMDVERYLLANALTGIVSQRLTKRLCLHCRVQRETNNYEKKIFKKVLGLDIDKIYDANEKGCEHCNNGYKGRIAIQEVLEITDSLRDVLGNEELTKEEREPLVYKEGVITLLQDGLIKVVKGITSFDEIYKKVEIDQDIIDEYSDDILKVNKKIIENEINDIHDDNEEIENEQKVPTSTEVTNNVQVPIPKVPTSTEVTNNVQVPIPEVPTSAEVTNNVQVPIPEVPTSTEATNNVQVPIPEVPTSPEVTNNVQVPIPEVTAPTNPQLITNVNSNITNPIVNTAITSQMQQPQNIGVPTVNQTEIQNNTNSTVSPTAASIINQTQPNVVNQNNNLKQ